MDFFLGFNFCYCIFVFIFLLQQSLLQFSFFFFAHLLYNSVFVIHFHCSQSRNDIQLIVFFLTVLFRVLLQNFKNFLILKSGFKSFIFSYETNSQQSIPFEKINVRKRIFRFDSHNTGLNLWWRLEVVFSDLYQMVNLGQKLDINTKSAVKLRARFCNESLGELFLEHKNCTAEHGFVGEEFEC